MPVQAERLPLRAYTTADGLAGDEVRCVMQDSRGFLWLGTTMGVSRFDGRVFVNYSTDDGLPSDSVSDVRETSSGELLVATTGGLCRLVPQRTVGQPLFVIERLTAEGNPGPAHVIFHGWLVGDRLGPGGGHIDPADCAAAMRMESSAGCWVLSCAERASSGQMAEAK
ncbi:MAG: hypothetical protein L0219_08135 [Phycisphaerales bacterium]|nr:hypothetical protein [Phycisphaerales bacterium]